MQTRYVTRSKRMADMGYEPDGEDYLASRLYDVPAIDAAARLEAQRIASKVGAAEYGWTLHHSASHGVYGEITYSD